jgi:hypothetical protein
LTGTTSPFDSSQSQNQFPQSSALSHVTFVAPDGFESPDEEPPDDEPPDEEPPDEEPPEDEPPDDPSSEPSGSLVSLE